LVRRPSGAEGDIIGGGRAATLSDLTAHLYAFHRVIADNSGRYVRHKKKGLLRYGDLNFCHRFGSANLAFLSLLA
jgi:hypothetical protein